VSERQHDTMLGAYTPLYASLEQMRGEPPDPRDDVHALGIIWFQMQTGVLALMAMPNDWREDLAEAKMPVPLLDLLAACIGKQARRPTDAGDLANRLVAALPSSPAARSSRAAEDAVGAATTLPASYTIAQAGIHMRLIPAGRFLMGSPADEEGHDKDETLHKVVLTKPYYLAAHPVTRGQFRRFVEAEQYATAAERGDGAYGWTGSEWKKDAKFNWKNPGFRQDDEHPVVCVSYNDAVAYCKWLSRVTGKTYGLPTEAQWEYACRGRTRSAGGVEITTEPYHFGKTITPKLAHFFDSRTGGTAYVGTYPANGFGLCDMHGNVLEWCADWYGEYPTSQSDNTDPQGAASGPVRVTRGGSWYSTRRYCRAAYRVKLVPSDRRSSLGFRVSRVPSEA
jgi:formylglycine-generating enzyme required for sulfatase activity